MNIEHTKTGGIEYISFSPTKIKNPQSSEEDWNLVLKVGLVANQIRSLITNIKPIKGISGLTPYHLYDLRGQIDLIPKLGIAFTTKAGLRAGMNKQPEGSLFSYMILFPYLFSTRLHKAIIKSQTLLHHEITHILLDHGNNKNYVKEISGEYFAQPEEVEAYFQQAIAIVAENKNEQYWNEANALTIIGEDQKEFVSKVFDGLPNQIKNIMFEQTADQIKKRIENLWDFIDNKYETTLVNKAL